MSQGEINDIMSKLTNNMAVVEDKVGREQARQKRVTKKQEIILNLAFLFFFHNFCVSVILQFKIENSHVNHRKMILM